MESGAGMAGDGQKRKIGKREVQAAAQLLQKYKQGKANLEGRIIDNEQWYKMRHWEQIRAKKAGEPEPASAWLLNSILNKHADAMDNYPEPNVLPREEGDKMDANQLSHILPVVLEHNQFEQTYSDTWWYKLKSGTGVYGVFWNPSLEGGLGDVDIKQMDILNLFWQPGIKDIQESRNLFVVELVDNDVLVQKYPQLMGKLSSTVLNIGQYVYDDAVDTSEKSAVVDWYYKVYGEQGEILHYCKYVNDEVLYASEDDPMYAERGFYDHGKYPIVFDTMFVEEGTPAGFGYIDLMKSCQLSIDKLNQNIEKNALMATRPRYFIKNTGSINEEEFADWSKDFVHVAGSSLGEDSIRPIEVAPLGAIYTNVLQMRIDELKETSGNRDFSQGSTTSGVTAASAIAALQEAGSKLSRDMIKSSYRAFAQINYFIIELIRQFYSEPRCFRIVGEQGEQQFVEYDNSRIQATPQGQDFGIDLGYRRPVFDIKVTSQKSSPFSKVAQNELAKELYSLGAFNPQMTDQALIMLDMMDFEGKDLVVQKVAQNGTLYQTLMQMQAQMQQMAMIIDAQNGTQLAPQMGAEMGQGAPGTQMPSGGGDGGGMVETNALGRAVKTSQNTTAATAQQRAAETARPK